jgi:hypothetical protein
MALRRGQLTEQGKWLNPDGRHKCLRYEKFELCLVPRCGQKIQARGMCNKHYLQKLNGIIDDAGNVLRPHMKPGRARRDRWSTRDGYVLIHAPPDHPHPRSDGSLLEHRHVVEQALGRYLEEWEIVHHKDGNRQNNCVENLELLDGRARKSTGHAPGSTMSEEQTKTALEHLRVNDSAAYARIIAGLP